MGVQMVDHLHVDRALDFSHAGLKAGDIGNGLHGHFFLFSSAINKARNAQVKD